METCGHCITVVANLSLTITVKHLEIIQHLEISSEFSFTEKSANNIVCMIVVQICSFSGRYPVFFYRGFAIFGWICIFWVGIRQHERGGGGGVGQGNKNWQIRHKRQQIHYEKMRIRLKNCKHAVRHRTKTETDRTPPHDPTWKKGKIISSWKLNLSG